MAEYQNIFTRVQVHPPAYAGVPMRSNWGRDGTPFMSYWLGKIGDAQFGPIYLGYGLSEGGNGRIYFLLGQRF